MVSFKDHTIPVLTLTGDNGDAIVTIYPDGRIKINEINRDDEAVDIFITALCGSMDTRMGGTGYRDSIFDRLLAVANDNDGILTTENLTYERNCVIIEDKLRGKHER